MGIAALAAVALPFAPFIRIGEQGYRPVAFIERVWLLRDLSSIDAAWVYPPAIALVGAAATVIALFLPDRWLRRILPAVTVLLLVAGVLVMRLVAGSSTASAAVGMWLFLAMAAAMAAATVHAKVSGR